MKKLVFLLLTAFAVASCNDDCDHQLPPPPPIGNWLAEGTGAWYEEEENEEMRFSQSGTWYDKYCNKLRSFETEGRYESDYSHKLTYNYTFMGQTQFADWTISNRDELSFTITSDKVGSHVLEKIVETYNMTIGKTQQISFANDHPNYTVQSYRSNNDRIASVSESGLITTNGEKGTTYIKISTNSGNAWVKVVVGDECLDLWYDYISLIGQSYTQVRTILGNPHQNDGDQGYFYAMELHDVVQQVSLWLNPRTRTVETFNLILKEGVPSEDVLTYMESRYYKLREIGKSVQFLNNSTLDNSIAMIEYNQDGGTIIINDINAYFNLWPNFTGIFGTDQTNVKKAAEDLKMTFSFDSKSYSPYGSDYYTDPYGEYMSIYGFVFNKAGQMFEYWAYMFDDTDKLFVANAIGENYVYDENETKTGLLVWYNRDRTIRVKLDVANNAVIYTDLTLEGLPKWPDYTSAFGMTLDELVATYGDLYFGILPMYYIVNDYVEYVYFNVDDNTGKTTAYLLNLNAGFSTQEIHEYLSSEYTFYKANETNTQFAYCDGPTRDVSSLQIVFNSEKGTITYNDIKAFESSNSSARKRAAKIEVPIIEKPSL